MKYRILFFLLVSMLLCSCYSQNIKIPEVFVEGDKKDVEDFYIMQFNTTVKEYKEYLKDSGERYNFDEWVYYDGPLSNFITSDECAMSHVNLKQIIEYANWLSKKSGLKPAYKIKKNNEFILDEKANGYRIPYEKEWRWAAIGGVKSKGFKYCGSDDPFEIAWFGQNANGMIQKPGLKKSNELNIYDMYGNVKEIMWDLYVYFPPNIILSGKNKTDCSLWQEKLDYYKSHFAQEFKNTNQKPYNIKLEELYKLNISLDQEYINNNLNRLSSRLNVNEWWDYSENQNPISNESDTAGEFYGIRLVRNAK